MLCRVEEKLDRLLEKMGDQMAQIDDLNAAVASLTQAESVEAADVQQALAALKAAAPANLQPAIDKINAAVAQMGTDSASLSGQMTPPSSTAPATGSGTSGTSTP